MPEVPSTFDRADGLDGHEGIATPAGAIFINDNGTKFDITDPDYALKLREACTSPEIERAEQATITHTFLTDYNEAITRLTTLGRGTLLVSDDGDVTRVLSAKIQRERGGFATLIVVCESVSFDNPPDEFDIQPVELGIHIIKHPRYFHALNPASTDATNFVTIGTDAEASLSDIKQSIIRAIQAYMDAPLYPSEYNINGYFQTNILAQLAGTTIDVPVPNPNFIPGVTVAPTQTWNGNMNVTTGLPDVENPDANSQFYIVAVPSNDPGILLAKAAAREIIEKIWRQEEQPYIVGYQMIHTSYWFRPPDIHPGGVLDDPVFGGVTPVPDYFLSTAYPPDMGYTLFDFLPTLNPQCYSVSGSPPNARGVYGTDYQISWLRKADTIDYQRTWFKLTRTWMGAPIGVWDPQLYFKGKRPSKPSDYVTNFVSLTP
jgi:hypothetical protein